MHTDAKPEFWEYDARLMRRWNTDPMAHAGQSLYEAFYSNPIAFADPLGLRPGGPGDPEKEVVVNGGMRKTVEIVAKRLTGWQRFWSGVKDFFTEDQEELEASYRQTTYYRLEHKKTKGPLDKPNEDFAIAFKRGWENPGAALEDNPYNSLNRIALIGIGGTMTATTGGVVAEALSPEILKEIGEEVVEEVTGVPVGLIGLGKEAIEYLGKKALNDAVEEGLEQTVKEGAEQLGKEGVDAAKGGFGSMMEAGEAARYAKYWESYAPKQISPGTTRMDWLRVSGRTGRMESSRVIYDNYGRQIYRVDFSNHMRPLNHSVPHLHQYQYGPMSSFGKESVFNFFGK